ncbi:DgyrCDS351 [Dimorphilus gyrociliatus]|uniref:DgyrCDS351 n=1 Tax=Dimorphilus gyrociliatus TaxID=2664684 RepID=A0A7I8V5J4_9ANNE|nr:DgyrCDS351 [Dimorphilus gyrociliatus]
MKIFSIFICLIPFVFVGCDEYPDKCLDGPYHRDEPAPETKEYKACKSFARMTCCTVELADMIHRNNAKELYKGFHWEWCGTLSESCQQFLRDEECFYQCEPQLWRFKKTNSTIANVPICSSYCDDWFKACKNDKTCVVNWLSDFKYSNSSYQCPDNSAQCRTFEEVYKDSKGLCNKMWGEAFFYETNEENCMKFHYDPLKEDPNKNVRPKSSTANTTSTPIASIVILFILSLKVVL